MIAAGPKQAPAATLVIFGVMGDLTRRLLVPALANLRREGFIGKGLDVLGVDKQDIDDEALRRALAEFVEAVEGRIEKFVGVSDEPVLLRQLEAQAKR